MNLEIIKETLNEIIITWEPEKNCNRYIVQGMTDLFSYKTLTVTTNTAAVIQKSNNLIGLRVACCVSDYVMTYSDTIMINSGCEKHYQGLRLLGIDTPIGCAISIQSSELYDTYEICDCESGEVIWESKDPIILVDTDTFKESVVIAHAYKDGELKAVTKDVINEREAPKFNPNPLLTIALPVYNTGRFLIRTLSSILLSTFTNYEIIIIDDSTDEETSNICNWYRSKYPNISLFRRDGRGICSARNLAIEKARGKWFAFVDADDIVHPYMYEKLMQAAKEYNTDIAISQVVIREDFNKSSILLDNSPDKRIIEKTYKDIIDKNNKNRMYFCGVWNKIVKTEIARKVYFPDDRPQYYEDIAYTPALYSYIDRFILVKDAWYIWDKRKRETVGTSSEEINDVPNILAWQLYIMAHCECLIQGDHSNYNIYAKAIYTLLLNKYKDIKGHKEIREVFERMLKYYFEKYKCPNLGNPPLDKLMADIQLSNTFKWDGKINDK